MSDHQAFRSAADIAKKAADRQGLVVSHMRWDGALLEWSGLPKREAKLAAAAEPAFEPRNRRGLQGALL